jgi:hypothetical protein
MGAQTVLPRSDERNMSTSGNEGMTTHRAAGKPINNQAGLMSWLDELV